MRLIAARIQKYRSIRDTGLFEIDKGKTILVGPNEAGKTAALQALQQINPPEGVSGFDALRDYPRSEYNDITTGAVDPRKVTVAEAHFDLEPDDIAALPPGYDEAKYVYGRHLDNSAWHDIEGGPERERYSVDLKKQLDRMAAHVDKAPLDEGQAKPSARLAEVTTGWLTGPFLTVERAASLRTWLDEIATKIDEGDSTEENRHAKLIKITEQPEARSTTLKVLDERRPVFVLFNNYFRVRPIIHLGHLAERSESGVLDDDQYDFGNLCLMKLLGFSARELSDLGRAEEPSAQDAEALQQYRDQLDKRAYQLNAASVKLTNEIRKVWNPDTERGEADKLRLVADGQYLKLVVEDDLGVEIELDQRSEGYQWLVSFFVVFFAETQGAHANAILLLDEPGLSLHGLKQREFRQTISRLAEFNQTVYTTHSPFLVGPDELNLVRVVEMNDRTEGTKVHTTISAGDPGALLPLQEALGYDLAQSLFAQQRNLILEGLTDYWYVEATAGLLAEEGIANLRDNIALVPASGAGKVAYFATILHAHKLKVAALLDSDAAGDAAAEQDTLIHQLGNKNILRTKDAYTGQTSRPEIEDLLRETLISVAKEDLGWDVTAKAAEQSERPLVELFAAEINGFSKYKLSKAYLRWTRDHKASDLAADERSQWETLISSINAALR
jgi:predicted ATP-dependent endonuclease of OLD family